MRYLKYLALLAVLMLPLAYSQAQVRVGVGIGFGPGYVAGPPVCAYGYYPYYPYACAPYGYYGPQWFMAESSSALGRGITDTGAVAGADRGGGVGQVFMGAAGMAARAGAGVLTEMGGSKAVASRDVGSVAARVVDSEVKHDSTVAVGSTVVADFTEVVASTGVGADKGLNRETVDGWQPRAAGRFSLPSGWYSAVPPSAFLLECPVAKLQR